MERLTTRHYDGTVSTVTVGDRACSCDATARLAAYEDTGLGPEEVKEHEAAYAEIMTRTYGPIHEKIGQWLQAERDGRLVVLPHDKTRWIKAILDERERQDQKWGYPQENTFCEWASILAEEVGELSRELNELNFGRGDFGLMEMEAVQVAAVALSILEQSAVAYGVTMQAAVAIGRLTREEAEAALKKREADT